MNCREWEERIALYAAGDTTPGEAAEIEGHIAGCVECRAMLNGMKQDLECMREAHQEAIAPAHYAAVRSRVLAQIEKQRAPRWKQALAYGLAGAAALVLAWMAVRPQTQTPHRRVTQAVTVPAAASVTAPVAAAAAVERPVRRSRRRKMVQPPTSEPETILVKLETGDPDVVIYWIAEKKGD